MEARRSHATQVTRHLARYLSIGLVGLVALSGCVPPGDDDATDSTIDVDRDNRADGDIEAAVGESIEVYGITATVTEVGRVAAYDELDTSGYIWARIRVENTTNRDINFNRRQFRLEKPDGMVSNTANISSQSQVEGGTTARSDVLAPGGVREGQVIYTAGDLDGQFALLYIPDSPNADPLDVERGVWVFESSPEDAE